MRTRCTRGACSTARPGQPRAKPRRGRTTTVLHWKCRRPFHAPFSDATLIINMRKTRRLPRVLPVTAIAGSLLIRATRFVAVVPRLSFRLGDQCELYPPASLTAPPLSVQYLANRPSLLLAVRAAP